MSSPQIFVFLVTIADLALSGLISNGFISTVTIREWIQCRSLASREQLLLSLALSNICTTVLLAPFLYNPYFMDNFLYNALLLNIFSSSIFVIMTRFWFTAWLCVFYCVKIVNSPHSLFLWCKMRISCLIPQLLMGSLVFSCFVSFLSLKILAIELQSNTTAHVTNTTQAKTLKDSLGSFRFFFLVVGSSSPLLVVLFCSIMVVASLCRHVYRMAGNMSSSKDLQIEAHIKATRAVLSLLFLYVSYFVAQTLTLVMDVRNTAMEHIFVSAVMMMYGPAQAATLILTNPKLKQAFCQLLQRKRSVEGQAKCAF